MGGLWNRYRGWPRWARIAAPVLLLLLVIGIASGGSTKKPTSASPATPTTTPTTTAPATTTTKTTGAVRGDTLAPARAARLAADGAAWQHGLHAYLAAAPRCFAGSRSAFADCLRAALAKWSLPFGRARRDAAADARTVTGTCNSRLLDYLGSGGAGDALTENMGFAQKDALERKLDLLNQTLEQLTIPAFKATDGALKAAESVC